MDLAELKVEELKPYDSIGEKGMAWSKVNDLIKKHNKLIDFIIIQTFTPFHHYNS